MIEILRPFRKKETQGFGFTRIFQMFRVSMFCVNKFRAMPCDKVLFSTRLCHVPSRLALRLLQELQLHLRRLSCPSASSTVPLAGPEIWECKNPGIYKSGMPKHQKYMQIIRTNIRHGQIVGMPIFLGGPIGCYLPGLGSYAGVIDQGLTNNLTWLTTFVKRYVRRLPRVYAIFLVCHSIIE